jgi:hypothetical protein
MKFAISLTRLGLILALAAVPALAQISINSPANDEHVNSPFKLDASASVCSSLSVTAIGYSMDNSSQTTHWNDQSISTSVDASGGWHTIHVKAWNGKGEVCVSEISVDVVTGGTGSSGSGGGGLSVVPSNATRVSAIQTLSGWEKVHDGGTPGSSSGTMSIASSPSVGGASRLFANELQGYGGERYWTHFSDDNTAENFLYDGWVYIHNSASGFKNLEFDLVQTMANGQTAMMAFQCDGWNHTWDYGINAGSASASKASWRHASAYCNPQAWAVNQWHHVQIYMSRNTSGDITYHAVWLDGNKQGIGTTAFGAFDLGWAPAIITQFQVDGSSSGTSYANVYLDDLTVYRW